MSVTVAELRAISDRLFTYLEETGLSDFEISEDYYWYIEQDEVYDPYQDPKTLSMGQLSDDLNELKSILDGESPPIGYALVWLSAILRNVGEKSGY